MFALWNRRQVVRAALLTPLGTALSVLGIACQQQPSPESAAASPTVQRPALSQKDAGVSVAVSLSMLHARSAESGHGKGKLPVDLGMSHIQGFMREPDGEVLLFGNVEPGLPLLTLEALVIALRNAYQDSPLVADAYHGVLGCTIDPWEGQADPWRIQKTTVFAMPHTASMGFRHVFVDYHLKSVSAGLRALGTSTDTVQSVWELWRQGSLRCAPAAGNTQKSMTHRYWFTPRTPEAPRFRSEGGTLYIDRPIGVQLLTEKMFMSQTGTHTGSAPAEPIAEQFAAMVTASLATNDIPVEYIQLRQDFRVIEVAKLLRFQEIPAETLAYFLREFPLASLETPAYVTGVYREEQGAIVCGGKVTEEVKRTGSVVRSQIERHQYQVAYRGGVEANVKVERAHIKEAPQETFGELRTRVRQSRPSQQSLMWTVTE